MWTALLLLTYCFYIGDGKPYVIPRNMSELCKEHTCNDGYGYKTFFRVDSEDMKQIRKEADIAFEMHFGIQGSSNGHVLLSPVLKPGDHDPVYEIVIGGGRNQFTEIRRNLRRNSGNSAVTQKILSPNEMRGFYVRLSEDGLLEFGNEGDVLPLLTYKDINPLDIRYFSFSAWYGSEVKFLYDCPSPDLKEPTLDSQEEAPPPMSASDQLKQMQIMYRPPWVSPHPNMEVSLGIKITSVKYDAFQSKLFTGMTAVIIGVNPGIFPHGTLGIFGWDHGNNFKNINSWTDVSMSWYPPKFNGTKSIKFRPGQIWRPKFFIFNSDSGVFDAKNLGLIRVMHTGEATFHFQTKTYTWCFDSSNAYSKWPHDNYVCSIVIQPWEAHDKISIKVLDPNDSKMQVYADIDSIIQNEWDVAMKQAVIKPETWNKVYVSDDNNTHQSDRLILNLQLTRRPTTYNIAFYTPLLVLLMFILMSFWTEPLKMERIWFYAGCVIVITMGLCYIDFLIPCHTMPSILVLYICVLAAVSVALLTQVCLRLSITKKICDTNTMEKILASSVFRTMFCLPAVEASTNGGYMIQDDDDASVAPKDNVEEMQRDNEQAQSSTKEFAEAIDKVLFFVYTVTFAVMLADHF